MKNSEAWKPTKYEKTKCGYRGSRDRKYLSIGSRLLADLTVAEYFKNIPLYANGILADLGCGNVPLYDIYKPYVKEVVCIDWDNTIHENGFLDYRCDLNSELPLDEQSLDTVVLSDVLEHIADPKILLHRVNRAMKNGGVIMMNVPFAYWLHEEPYDYYRYTEHGLQHLLGQSGFRTVKIIPLGSFFEIIADLICKFVIRKPIFAATIVGIVQSGQKLLRGLHSLNKVVSKASSKMPLGYFVVAIK
jgi:SAM-dependent methyltransferase